MAYYSGQAASYQELLDALVTACIEQGWTWADGILSKGNAFIKLIAQNVVSGYLGSGIIIQGGTGKTGVNLANASFSRPRLGRTGEGSRSPEVQFPCNYNIHIFENPLEVFCVIRFKVNKFYYLAFGLSNIDLTNSAGTGLWLSATTRDSYSLVEAQNGFVIDSGGAGGGATSFNYAFVSGGPFYRSFNINQYKDGASDTIHTGLGGDAWAGSYATINGGISASLNLAPMLSRLPSNWSNNADLLPISIHQNADSSKIKLVAELVNARYIRINNLEPEQIISFGSEKWKIYPFFEKNIASANTSLPLQNHTGTFGWAIRYDGP